MCKLELSFEFLDFVQIKNMIISFDKKRNIKNTYSISWQFHVKRII